MKKIYCFVLLALSLQFISNNCHALENKQANDKFLSRADLYYISTMLKSKPAELDQWTALLMINGNQDSSLIYRNNSKVKTSILPVARYKNYADKYVVTIYKHSSDNQTASWNQTYVERVHQKEQVAFYETIIIWILICVCTIYGSYFSARNYLK